MLWCHLWLLLWLMTFLWNYDFCGPGWKNIVLNHIPINKYINKKIMNWKGPIIQVWVFHNSHFSTAFMQHCILSQVRSHPWKQFSKKVQLSLSFCFSSLVPSHFLSIGHISLYLCPAKSWIRALSSARSGHRFTLHGFLRWDRGLAVVQVCESFICPLLQLFSWHTATHTWRYCITAAIVPRQTGGTLTVGS